MVLQAASTGFTVSATDSVVTCALSLSDDRFEIVDGKLRVKGGQSWLRPKK